MVKAGICVGIALAAAACTSSPSIEDGENDSFTSGGKADAFGVEEGSPDGNAVLQLATTADASTLENDVGLSARAANSIVEHRGYTTLTDLDAAPYVGYRVFHAMLDYAAQHHLYKTSFRLPLLVEDENGENAKSITAYNDKAVAAGKPAFPAYVWVDDSTDYSALADGYNATLSELGTTDQVLIYAYAYDDFTAGSQNICYVGLGTEVGDLVQAQAGTMVGEMYIVWGWRSGADKWVDDNLEDESELGDDWSAYDTKSRDVLVVYSNDDDGSSSSSDAIASCR